MTSPAKGLYAPRLVDLTFVLMGLGSAALLIKGGSLPVERALGPSPDPASGLYLFAAVLLVVLASCLMHKVDQRGWDDYMGQVVSQSALIAMVTMIIVAPAFDFLIAPTFGLMAPAMLIQGMLPIACMAWAIGYFFLRWKGTSA